MHHSTIKSGALPRRRLSLRFTENTMPSRTAPNTAPIMPLTRRDLQRIVEEMVG